MKDLRADTNERARLEYLFIKIVKVNMVCKMLLQKDWQGINRPHTKH